MCPPTWRRTNYRDLLIVTIVSPCFSAFSLTRPTLFSDLARKDKSKELLSEAHAAKQKYMEAYTSAMRVSLASPLRFSIHTRSHPTLYHAGFCLRSTSCFVHQGGLDHERNA